MDESDEWYSALIVFDIPSSYFERNALHEVRIIVQIITVAMRGNDGRYLISEMNGKRI